MRTLSRLAVASTILGGSLLLAGPAVAQSATDCDEYPADCPIGGGVQQPAIDEDEDSGEAVIRGSSGGAASLPFTGGEVTLIALAGTAALGGGIALTVAGRKRATA